MDDLQEFVSTAETALRAVVKSVLGDRWLESHGAPNPNRLEKNRDRARERRDGAVVPDGLEAFLDIQHIIDVVEANWSMFEPVFKDRDRTLVLLDVLRRYRNERAHNREMVPFERSLLRGASGQLRNQIGLYRSSVAGHRDHYPVIERVSDQFGNVGTDDSWSLRGSPQVRLDVGSQLLFECRGFDPRGRTIEWVLTTHLEASDLTEAENERWKPLGKDDRLVLHIDESMVGEKLYVNVLMRSTGKHHLESGMIWTQVEYETVGFDQMVRFTYAVNPPPD